MIDTEAEEMAEGWGEYTDVSDDDNGDDESDLFHDIYVETASSFLYEVHMFETFCLVRPASPNMYAGIRKVSHLEFSKEFHEYGGDPDVVREILRGAAFDFVIEA